MRSVERKAHRGPSLLRGGRLWANSRALSPVRMDAGPPRRREPRAGTVMRYGHVVVARAGRGRGARAGGGGRRRAEAVAAPPLLPAPLLTASPGADPAPGPAVRAAVGTAEDRPGAEGRGDLVGGRALRGRARVEGPALSGARGTERRRARRQDHQQAPRGAARGDRAAAGDGGRRAGAAELPGDGRAADRAGGGLDPDNAAGGTPVPEGLRGSACRAPPGRRDFRHTPQEGAQAQSWRWTVSMASSVVAAV